METSNLASYDDALQADEALRVVAQDCYYDYLDALEGRGADERAVTFEQFCNQPRSIPISQDFATTDDDFPF